jgi:hypothetical protein
MASVQSDLERDAVTAHKWANRHKKARRGKRRRHSDFIRKSLVRINVEYGLEPHRITLQPAQAGRLALLWAISEGKRGGNEKAAANQQCEGDTAKDGENALPAIDGLGIAGGSLRRQEAHPKVTHGTSPRSWLGET